MTEIEGKALRPHSKSRGGCRVCKQRRVKCNEGRPKCDSCNRREEQCDYIDEPPRSRKARHEPVRSPSSARYNSSSPIHERPPCPLEDFRVASSRETSERRLLEIRLVHHFLTSTVQDNFLSIHDKTMSEIWLRVAPALALGHPFLMHSILSIAALHITKTHPGCADMSRTYRLYFNAALSQHREAVRNLNSFNAEAACISAILISLPPIALLQDPEFQEPTMYSPPVHIFNLLAGNIPLFTSALPFISPTSQVNTVINTTPTHLHQSTSFILIPHFMALLQSDPCPSPETQFAYHSALQYISFILSQISAGLNSIQLRELWLAFPTFAPPLFVEGLRTRDPKALVILAYFFVLARTMDDVWWMKGIAEREVLGVVSVLPGGWTWAMEWAMERLDL